MRYAAIFVCLLATVVLHMPAFADNRLDGMKKMNSEGCIGMAGLDPALPKDATQVKPFCICTYDAYFEEFTRVELDQLFSGRTLPEKVQSSLPGRLERAQARCRKKIGF